MENIQTIIEAAGLIVGGLVLIATITPSKKDDKILAKVKNSLDLLSGFKK